MIFILASKQPALRKILSLVLTALVLISGMLMSAPMLRSHAEDAPDPMDAIVDFNPRTTAPKNNSYYTSKNAYYQCGYGMPNCTAYAYGRAYEILQKKPKLCMGNAYEWYGYNKSKGYYDYGKKPRLGAIACWGRGHVAVVEKIKDGKVTVSESHYSGRYFDTKQLTQGKESNYCGSFQGYIYIL
ncbi:MAG: CHAP domain-containing protein [Acutalibacteraceae bacterium]|nr:CHAP domain-containing protein [Acutalibacteraceae bacterium]